MELIEQLKNGVLAVLAAVLLLFASIVMLVDAIIMQVARVTGFKPAASPFERCFVKREYWGVKA